MCTYVMSGLDRRHRSDIRDSTIEDGVGHPNEFNYIGPNKKWMKNGNKATIQRMKY